MVRKFSLTTVALTVLADFRNETDFEADGAAELAAHFGNLGNYSYAKTSVAMGGAA